MFATSACMEMVWMANRGRFPMATGLRCEITAKSNMKAITHPVVLGSLARAALFATAAVAAGTLLVIPVPAWGWAALRAFLQF